MVSLPINSSPLWWCFFIRFFSFIISPYYGSFVVLSVVRFDRSIAIILSIGSFSEQRRTIFKYGGDIWSFRLPSFWWPILWHWFWFYWILILIFSWALLMGLFSIQGGQSSNMEVIDFDCYSDNSLNLSWIRITSISLVIDIPRFWAMETCVS